MSNVGQVERKTQDRVVKLLSERLGYEYLGNWEDRIGNSNVEVHYLRPFLEGKGYSDELITRAIDTLERAARDQSKSLYDANKAVYTMLRYGVAVQDSVGNHRQTVHFIDWSNLELNHFGVAEEVTVQGNKTKRPDIVLYVNGIALGVLELKRSTVSASEGIRQNLGNQKNRFIRQFFSTMQLVMAGNDTQGLYYGTIETPEDYYLSWKEDGYEEEASKLDRQVLQVCSKQRLLEIVHDFIVFDSGIKKTCRQNQYFGIKAAQEYVKDHKSGILWHTQGSGKSLTMVWLAKWIRENIDNSRVLVLTDRTELDEQIEGVFLGVDEQIYRTKSCRDLVEKLNTTEKQIICSLIHKFGARNGTDDENVEKYMAEILASIGDDFEAKGDIYVFVDECHRSHTGKLHEEMLKLLPNATFIGFTGTPLLSIDKGNSVVTWGPYIHTYKYDEAVRDGVVLDLRYEARRVDQNLDSQDKVDEWFEERTKGLTDVAKAELKRRWGTMQTLLSSSSRLQRVVFDILDDFYKKHRLASGRGNAMLVASSIHEACQYYELFQQNQFTKCAVVTSYGMDALSTDTNTYAVYQRMLENYKRDYGPIEKKTGEDELEAYERLVKEKFIKQPGQMQLLIVVDKLLTGFDAPPATYLFVDKNMQDHGLFQAICRVNRLDGEDKEYGYIVDYRDLFKRLEKAVADYTSEVFDAFDKEDVIGLLKDRVVEGKKDLEEALETVRALCEPVIPPDTANYIKYFCGDTENPYAVKETEPLRVKLYRTVSHLLRVYADMANDMRDAGYSDEQAKKIAQEVDHYEKVRTEIKLASGDYIDLKKYEPDMRRLIDRYVSASESEHLTSFEDMSLVDLIVRDGESAIENLPESVKKDRNATAETIENNVRKLIIDEMPTNPRYYLHMSEILADLVAQRKRDDIAYEEYLQRIVELSKHVKQPAESDRYPSNLKTKALQALYDNLDEDEEKAIKVDEAIRGALTADFRGHPIKERRVRNAISEILNASDEEVDRIFDIVKSQDEY